MKAGTLSLRRFQLEELERATKNFSDDSLLGSGAFAKVYKGTFELEGTALAIKRDHAESYQSTEEFRNGKPDQPMQACTNLKVCEAHEFEWLIYPCVYSFFETEVNLLSKVKHRNLVGLVGFCEQTGIEMLHIESFSLSSVHVLNVYMLNAVSNRTKKNTNVGL